MVSSASLHSWMSLEQKQEGKKNVQIKDIHKAAANRLRLTPSPPCVADSTTAARAAWQVIAKFSPHTSESLVSVTRSVRRPCELCFTVL